MTSLAAAEQRLKQAAASGNLHRYEQWAYCDGPPHHLDENGRVFITLGNGTISVDLPDNTEDGQTNHILGANENLLAELHQLTTIFVYIYVEETINNSNQIENWHELDSQTQHAIIDHYSHTAHNLVNHINNSHDININLLLEEEILPWEHHQGERHLALNNNPDLALEWCQNIHDAIDITDTPHTVKITSYFPQPDTELTSTTIVKNYN